MTNYNTEKEKETINKMAGMSHDHHSFHEGIAKDYSIDAALFLDRLRYLTEINLGNNNNFHDGLCWTYDTLDAIAEKFSYYSKRQVERIINYCVKHGLIRKGNYNKKKYDRTNWYTLEAKSYIYFPHLRELIYKKRHKLLILTISPNGEMDFTKWCDLYQLQTQLQTNKNNNGEKSQPTEDENSPNNGTDNNLNSPKIGTANSPKIGIVKQSQNWDTEPKRGNLKDEPNNNAVNSQPSDDENSSKPPASPDGSPSSRSKKKSKTVSETFMLALVAVYHEVFPDNPGHNPRVLSTELERVLSKTVRNWHKVAGKECTEESFRRYLTNLKHTAPDFSMKEYETSGGRRRKNNLVNLARFNTVVKHTEGFYS